MSGTVEALQRARDVAWVSLVPVFDHAIVLALEAEHHSYHTSMSVQANCPPAYPPLVELLAASAPIGEAGR